MDVEAPTLRQRVESTVLTKKGRIAAQYILDNQNEVAYLPATSLAKKIGMCDVTIHRLAKQIGYESYSALQKSLQDSISQQLTNSGFVYRSPGEVMTEKFNGQTADAVEVIHESVRVATENVNAMYRKLSAEVIESSANALLNARRVYVAGFWSAAALAELFVEKFLYNNDNIFSITSTGPEGMARAMSIQKHDCLLVYSVNRPISALERIVKIAKEKGATIILIANKETCWLASYADHCLVGSTEGVGFLSLVAPLLISEILLSCSVSKVWKKRKKYTDSLNTLLEDMDYYKD